LHSVAFNPRQASRYAVSMRLIRQKCLKKRMKIA
jgi:hypothetical protein